MSPVLATSAAAAAAYLLGSIPTGFLVARMKGVDLRQVGSGNIGATNTMRALGKRVGLAVFALDFVKGLIPAALFPRVLLARELAAPLPGGPDGLALLFGVLAILGHVFPVWLGFKGGKGVATSAGACAALHLVAVLATFALWYALLKATRYVSLASILAALAFPFIFIALAGTDAAFGERRIVTLVGSLIALAILLLHRSNIGRLLRGEERRVGEKIAEKTTP